MLKLKRVVCAISGGVDSCVTALILKRKGYEVVGVYMRNWDLADDVGHCTADVEAEDAAWICKKLDIPFREVSFVKEYWNEVFSYLVSDYEAGFTPNPDILCNKRIKFDCFFNHAMENIQADAVATGHYARTSFGEDLQFYNPRRGVRLLKAMDQIKDQTFFLSQVNQWALQRSVFPLGDYTKEAVKKIAMAAGFQKIAQKPESVGICFIGSRNFQDFIREYAISKPGNFVDIESGKVVGKHSGIHLWTIGQRARLPGLKNPFYIQGKDIETREITVAPACHHPSLYTNMFFTGMPHWIHSPPKRLLKDRAWECHMSYQSRLRPIPASVSLSSNNCLVVQWREPQRAVTPGQFAVFYRGEECVGSARILRVGPSIYAEYLQKTGPRHLYIPLPSSSKDGKPSPY